jgi:hypothetical protein
MPTYPPDGSDGETLLIKRRYVGARVVDEDDGKVFIVNANPSLSG